MNRSLAALAAAAVVGLYCAPTASAQIGGYQPPTVNPNPTYSPYLNLIPNNPFIQYFGLGQTQQFNTKAIQSLQQQLAAQQTGMYPLGVAPGLPTTGLQTGHPVTFQNLSYYYPQPGQPFAGMGGGLGMGGYGLGGYGGNPNGGNFGTNYQGAMPQVPLGYGGVIR